MINEFIFSFTFDLVKLKPLWIELALISGMIAAGYMNIESIPKYVLSSKYIKVSEVFSMIRNSLTSLILDLEK